MYVAPEHEKEAFTCPHCQVLTTQYWADLSVAGVPIGSRAYTGATPISRSTCFNCGEDCFWYDDKMLYPTSVNVPMPNPDLPEDMKHDYLEARQIVTASPAALPLSCVSFCKSF